MRRVKELFFLYLITAPQWRIGGMKVKLHAFFTSAIGGRKRSALCGDRFIPEEKETGTYWAGGRLDLKIGLKTVAE
jgi:hypothetical protein